MTGTWAVMLLVFGRSRQVLYVLFRVLGAELRVKSSGFMGLAGLGLGV